MKIVRMFLFTAATADVLLGMYLIKVKIIDGIFLLLFGILFAVAASLVKRR